MRGQGIMDERMKNSAKKKDACHSRGNGHETAALINMDGLVVVSNYIVFTIGIKILAIRLQYGDADNNFHYGKKYSAKKCEFICWKSRLR